MFHRKSSSSPFSLSIFLLTYFFLDLRARDKKRKRNNRVTMLLNQSSASSLLVYKKKSRHPRLDLHIEDDSIWQHVVFFQEKPGSFRLCPKSNICPSSERIPPPSKSLLSLNWFFSCLLPLSSSVMIQQQTLREETAVTPPAPSKSRPTDTKKKRGVFYYCSTWRASITSPSATVGGRNETRI